MMAGLGWPVMVLYSSAIQAMTMPLVYMSGAGMSRSGPMNRENTWT